MVPKFGSLPSRMDNGGRDGWAVLDRIIHEAPMYLKPQGCLVFIMFEFLREERVREKLAAAGLEPCVIAREEQPFPRIARERLEYIRSLDAEGSLPPGRPTTCSRPVLCGEKTNFHSLAGVSDERSVRS